MKQAFCPGCGVVMSGEDDPCPIPIETACVCLKCGTVFKYVAWLQIEAIPESELVSIEGRLLQISNRIKDAYRK